LGRESCPTATVRWMSACASERCFQRKKNHVEKVSVGGCVTEVSVESNLKHANHFSIHCEVGGNSISVPFTRCRRICKNLRVSKASLAKKHLAQRKALLSRLLAIILPLLLSESPPSNHALVTCPPVRTISVLSEPAHDYENIVVHTPARRRPLFVYPRFRRRR
jgi:hypothetical protein